MKKIIIISALALTIACTAFYFYNQSNKEYIGGNILNFPHSVIPGVEPVTTLPWAMNGLIPHLMYRTLMTADYTLLNNYQPDLASKIEILENGYLYRVHFIEGAKWSDGTDLTLDDVVFSIETLPKVTRANNLYKNAFKHIESLTINGNILDIRMKERNNMMQPMLAQLAILPEHKVKGLPYDTMMNELYFRDPVVSGMFRVGHYEPESHYILVLNEQYKGVKPKITEVYLRFTNTSEVRYDYYFTNNVADMLNYRAIRGYQEHIVDMLFYRYFVFNIEGVDGNKNPAMADVRVRQAICMAIDRESLLHSVFYSMGNIVNGPGEIGALGPYNYNPERAKELLAESGYDMNRTLRFAYYYGDTTSKNFVDAVVKQLEAIGFKVEATRQGGNIALYEDREYDFMLKGFGATRPSEWYEEYSSTNPWMNKLLGGKGELDDLIKELMAENDPDKLQVLLDEISVKELELLYKYPLHTLNQSVYINTERIKLPSTFKHGNYFYSFDYNFENWEIKKQ